MSIILCENNKNKKGVYMDIYNTKILSIGSMANSFSEAKIIILFGSSVPPELKDYCYEISVNPLIYNPDNSMKLYINDVEYKITAVGDEVFKNLSELGHVTLNFNNSEVAELPGTIYLEDKPIPKININDIIKISSN